MLVVMGEVEDDEGALIEKEEEGEEEDEGEAEEEDILKRVPVLDVEGSEMNVVQQFGLLGGLQAWEKEEQRPGRMHAAMRHVVRMKSGQRQQ